jgi:hypothetical protein
MLTRLLAMAADRTRLVVLVSVAVLAGATGGVWAATNVAGPGITVTSVADEKGGAAKADKPDKPAKQKGSAAERGGAPQGAHGACVSAVARSSATGGENDNHGGAVSRAAHTCAPNAAGASDRAAKPSKAPKPSKSPKPTASESATAQGGQPGDAGKPTDAGSPSTGGKPTDLPTPDSTTTPTTATTTATATATATP